MSEIENPKSYEDTIDHTGAAHFEHPLPPDAKVTVEMRRQIGAVFIVKTGGVKQEYILRYGEKDLPQGTAIPWHPNEHHNSRF